MSLSSEQFRVLFVCTGNICRSAIAEQVFRARYGSESVAFASAGTGALVGAPMPEQAADISRRLGGDPQEHSGKQLSRAFVEAADVVIALTREHRSEIVRTLPRASRYTFTLREFARLMESYQGDAEARPLTQGPGVSLADTLRSAVPILAAQRGYAEAPPTPDDDDVIDPYRRPQEIYDLSGAQISDAVDRIAFAVEILKYRR
ncbi:protein-tyrosine phosphatase [Glaciihabitans tibetensis]|uniref:protein-tyrosine-phosphatase n=1 Tax=Glaciihabitans tibetensis TaxID=1266600 RepID=A0A2T0V3E6_9MICO|nr:low molecular weight phosphatase family protein [Glaciihabitans tibetensis]PRY64647.1 protein-tyrosine phosphatase [Glaciihabitans tibetensis]